MSALHSVPCDFSSSLVVNVQSTLTIVNWWILYVEHHPYNVKMSHMLEQRNDLNEKFKWGCNAKVI